MWLFKIGDIPCHLIFLPTCNINIFEIKGFKAIGEEMCNVGN